MRTSFLRVANGVTSIGREIGYGGQQTKPLCVSAQSLQLSDDAMVALRASHLDDPFGFARACSCKGSERRHPRGGCSDDGCDNKGSKRVATGNRKGMKRPSGFAISRGPKGRGVHTTGLQSIDREVHIRRNGSAERIEGSERIKGSGVFVSMVALTEVVLYIHFSQRRSLLWQSQ
jgi:hypothetical protein